MPGQPPTRVGGSVSDLAAALCAFGAVNAALVHRFRTGTGQHLDVNLLASTLSLLPDPVAQYFDTGQRPRRVGNRNLNLTPAEAYPTKDGMIQVVMMNPDQYDRFCKALGDGSLATDPRFATNDARLAHYDDFRARVERALASATTAEWQERFDRAQIAAGPGLELCIQPWCDTISTSILPRRFVGHMSCISLSHVRSPRSSSRATARRRC